MSGVIGGTVFAAGLWWWLFRSRYNNPGRYLRNPLRQRIVNRRRA